MLIGREAVGAGLLVWWAASSKLRMDVRFGKLLGV